MKPGTRVADRYELLQFLGRGGFGEVWSASDTTERERRAIKFLVGPAHGRPDLRARFLTEARIANAFVHPHLVQVFDVLQLEDDRLALVMELLQGQTLGQRLEGREPVPMREVASTLGPIVAATMAVHEHGIVHRDIKPENIFLARTPWGLVMPKLLDFGLAKLTGHDANGIATSTGATLGTPCYMAPEQAYGDKDVDARADVFALGVVAYECLSGSRPIEAGNLGQYIRQLGSAIIPLGELAPEVPLDVAGAVMQMLSIDRAKRPELATVLTVLTARYSQPGGARSTEEPTLKAVGAFARQSVDTEPLPTRRQLRPTSEPEALPQAGESRTIAPPLRSRWAVGAVGGLILALVAAAVTVAVDPGARLP